MIDTIPLSLIKIFANSLTKTLSVVISNNPISGIFLDNADKLILFTKIYESVT